MRFTRQLLTIFAMASVAGCSLSDLVGKGDVPVGTPQPGIIASPEGAVSAYHGAVAEFVRVYGARSVTGFGVPFVLVSGLMSDELGVGVSSGGALALDAFSSLDARILPEFSKVPVGTNTYGTYEELFRNLQIVRNITGEAIASLRAYAPDAPSAYMGHAYAVKGYAEVMLADIFCSGIPLSSLVFEGDVTLRPGSTVNEVYTHAIALFDTAISMSADSSRILNLARVGKGRALIALGKYADAELAVKDVPDMYEYAAQYSATYNFPNYVNAFFTGPATTVGLPNNLTVADKKGSNGLDFVSANDPRVPTEPVTSSTKIYPAKFSRNGDSPLPVASGIEARLIEVEADLATDNPRWLTRLNALRTTCTDAATCPTPAPAGIGGKPGLAPLAAPAGRRAQIALLFRERGFWLYLGGQRQGDLRRLVRVYGLESRDVYPTGQYHGAAATYGDDINAPIPPGEIEANPNIQGCLNRHD